MNYGLYLSAAGALTESARHSVIANNIANVSTPGFKADLAVIQARDAEAIEGPSRPYATPMDALGGGVFIHETYTQHGQGTIEKTNNQFDLAIKGDGFFAVSDGEEIAYTRAGVFTRDTTGRLVMPDGKFFLADGAGGAVELPLEGEIIIARDGTVSVDGEPSGTIDTFAFSDTRALEKTGANRYANRGATRSAGTGRIEQGAVEASNANPSVELSRMLMAMRGYEANIHMIRMQDQSLSDLMSIGRVTI